MAEPFAGSNETIFLIALALAQYHMGNGTVVVVVGVADFPPSARPDRTI